MRWLLVLALCCWAGLAHAGLNTACHQPGPGGQPAPAVAWNYNCLRIYDNWRTPATIDASDTRAFGYTWYTHNGSTQTPPGAFNNNGWALGLVGVTPATDWSLTVPGQVTIHPVSGTPYANYPSQFMSCAQIGTTQTLIGRPVPVGYYIKINRPTSGVDNSTTGGIWNIGWLQPTPMMTAGVGAAWAGDEVDIFEDPFGFFIHDWSISFQSTIYNNFFAAGISVSYPGDIGVLSVPGALNAGVTKFERYFNDSVIANTTCTATGSATATCNGSASTVTLVGLNTDENCLTLGGGLTNGIIFGPVEVWSR